MSLNEGAANANTVNLCDQEKSTFSNKEQSSVFTR